jgi:DNA-binding helix-hairpin-helix protein with protein kinase domain
MAQSLVDWRQALERAFVFDPTRGIDPADLRALDTHLALQRAQLERELGAGAPRLDQIRRTIGARRQTLQPLLTAATVKVAQVEADLRGL